MFELVPPRTLQQDACVYSGKLQLHQLIAVPGCKALIRAVLDPSGSLARKAYYQIRRSPRCLESGNCCTIKQ